MKLWLICVSMGLGLVFADRVLHEERSTQMKFHKRAEVYGECIERYLFDALDEFHGEDDVTRGAVSDAADGIRACLALNTYKAAPERRQNMVSCAFEAYLELKQDMVKEGKSEHDVSRVVARLMEYQVSAMSFAPPKLAAMTMIEPYLTAQLNLRP